MNLQGEIEKRRLSIVITASLCNVTESQVIISVEILESMRICVTVYVGKQTACPIQHL